MYRTSFVGRQAELAELGRMLAGDARLVTVVGPPGIGKTRLVARFTDDTRLPTRFVDLTEARCAGDLVRLVADIPTNDVLVVLDNFEHLVDAGAPIVSEWLEHHERVRWLVTSREELLVAGERVLRLDPLDVPGSRGDPLASPAVRLFLDRGAGYTYAPADLPDIVAVVRRLEGIPLALELAASRLRVLTPRQLAERLHGTFDVLGGSARDASARHATLRRAIGWSWSLLDDAERSALVQCACFRGTFPLVAAEAVVRVEGVALLDVLQSLTEKSLLRTLREPRELRFAMYQSIRAFARERREDVPAARAAELRHGLYYAQLTRDLGARGGSGRGRSLVRTLSLDLDNLMGAFEGLLEHPDTLKAAVERAVDDSHAVLLQLAGRGKLGAFHAYRDALAHVREAVSDHAGEVAPPLRAAMFRFIGASYALLFRVDRAHTYFDRALSVAARAGDDAGRARILYSIGAVHVANREWGAARRCLDEALLLARAAGAPTTSLNVLALRGNAHMRRGRPVEALAAYDEALALARAVAARDEEAQLLCNSAIALQERGAFDESLVRFEQSLAIHTELGAARRAAAVLAYRGTLAHERGELAEAIATYESALTRVGATAARRIEGLISCWLVSARAASDDATAAAAALEVAEARCHDLGDLDLLRCLEIHRGSLALARYRAHLAASDRSAAADEYALARAAATRSPDLTESQRFALRIVSAELEAVTFDIARDGTWFRPPGGERVDLTGRPRLVRLVAALVDQHIASPASPLAVDALIEAVWPDERMEAQSAHNRVQVALTTARKLGLREVIARVDDGYLLDAIALRVSE